MNLLKFYKIIVMVIFAISNFGIVKAMENSNAITGASSFILNEAQLKSLTRKVASGDYDAALKISRHYSLGLNNTEKSQHWLTVAATLGNVDSQYELSSNFFEENDLLEAEYWAQLAAEKNNLKAKNLIKKIKQAGLKTQKQQGSDQLHR